MTEVAATPHGLTGKIIGDGRYDLRELLGGGSMGHVYRALDRRLETQVVLKIPHRNRLEHADFQRRFRQESRFLVRLRHPHIVGILDLGEHDGLPYFVMPFVPGGNLRHRQRNEFGLLRPLPAGSLSDWLRPIAEALDFIHSNHCVHRDVKPDNILFDEHGRVLLSDFGLSKILEVEGSEEVAQTAAGAIVGTPLYVAPELVLGESFDGRADQYSLAVTVYEVLSGANPFEGSNSSATMVNQTTREPPLLFQVNPRIGRELSAAVARGLCKRPEDRWETCVEFADDVLSAVEVDPAGAETTVSPRGASRRSSMIAGVPKAATPAGERVDASASQVQPRPAVASAVRFVAKASSPIVKAKSQCPSCARPLTLQPSYAGKRATCKSCGARLQISADFSELQQLESVDPLQEMVKAAASETSRQNQEKSDLVLGQELFGWKLSRTWTVRLAIVLGLFLAMMLVLFTYWHGATEREKLRDQLRPRALEG